MADKTRPRQPEKFGHIADLINAYLDRHDMTIRELAERLAGPGAEPSLKLAAAAGVSVWRLAKAAPGPRWRSRLAGVIEVPEAELMPAGEGVRQDDLGPARSAALVEVSPPPAAARPPTPVFRLALRPDGLLQVQLDITLPAQQGMVLARYLMDFGLTGNGDAGDNP